MLEGYAESTVVMEENLKGTMGGIEDDNLEMVGGPLGHVVDEELDELFYSSAAWEWDYEAHEGVVDDPPAVDLLGAGDLMQQTLDLRAPERIGSGS